MPFVPVPNTALTEIRVIVNGQKCESTLWFEHATAIDATALGALGIAVRDWYIAGPMTIQTSGLQLIEVVSTDMTTSTGLQDVSVPADPTFGASTANAVPNNVTLSISFRTGTRGRSFRGRNYVLGMTEDQIAGNQVVAGLTALWVGFYEDLIGVASDAGWQWVVASRFSGVDPVTHQPIPRVTGVTTPVITVLAVDDNIDSARRRLTGRGT